MKKIYLGTNEYGERTWLTPSVWDCNWYWSFGYLGNSSCHYHLGSLSKDCNLRDGIEKHFTNFPLKGQELWVFCELAQTAYALKKTAEVLGRGGSHYTKNPVADLIKNHAEVERINKIVLPAIFAEIYKLFGRDDLVETLKPI